MPVVVTRPTSILVSTPSEAQARAIVIPHGGGTVSTFFQAYSVTLPSSARARGRVRSASRARAAATVSCVKVVAMSAAR